MAESHLIYTRSGRYHEFVPTGSGSLVRIEDEAAPYLAHLARTFPSEFRRALRNVGWRLREQLKEAATTGRAGGESLPELSDIRRFRAIERLKQGRANVRKETWRRFRAGSREYSGRLGRLGRAVGFRLEPSQMRVQIGYLSPSAARWYRSIAAGRGGTTGVFQFGETQVVTPAMRRMLAAIGYPTRLRTIRRERRETVTPVFNAVRPELQGWIEERIAGYLRDAALKKLGIK